MSGWSGGETNICKMGFMLWFIKTDFDVLQIPVESRCPQKIKSKLTDACKIVLLAPSSELSSLHSEVHPSLLPTSLGGSQEDKVRVTKWHKIKIFLINN